MPSERELLEAWAGGDMDAAAALYRRHIDGVSRFFLSKVDDGADDLVQRTFEACVKFRARLQHVSSFRAYVFTIARNELYAWVRRRRSDTSFDSMVLCIADAGPSPSAAAAAAQDQQRLLAALRGLPIDLQMTLELYYWEQLSTEELAEVLSIPRGTVKSRLFRAREALRERLGELDETGIEDTMTRLTDWAKAVRREAPDGSQ
ncbi:MAG: sigma-70 family RNA polymerase sigma factor [Myxococcota bacterium]